ncbi:MAG: hypothetical protein DWQ44_07120 [Bacteroidetes bacterium]|nr:MAG: hypothetical protein DWQ33_12570 [Bacteroidota bacterium]REJ99787.1 MAG: hypothetical protein DWQ39_12740 [Bacteroidota bacterium]REK34160.1 MAG: hypothetical protein DWQ44_07120 [Bacteroidota bacterium]REK50490.1 MAG: hypothetical protein DWQ48_04030 [Bacteroidota bacterium]
MENKKQQKDEKLIDLGIVIRKLRLKQGFKSAEIFSYEFNLNRTAYWRWENGQNITMKNFFRLCSIHNMSPLEVFEMMEKNKTEPRMAAEPARDQYDAPGKED